MLSPHGVNRALDRITKACNEKEIEDAKAEGRAPEVLPHFSCHHLRHTLPAFKAGNALKDKVNK